MGASRVGVIGVGRFLFAYWCVVTCCPFTMWTYDGDAPQDSNGIATLYVRIAAMASVAPRVVRSRDRAQYSRPTEC